MDFIVTIIEIIISIPLLGGLLLLFVGAVFFVIDIIIKAVRILLKPFGIELNVGNIALKFINCISSLWISIKKAGKKVWVASQIIIVLVVVFLFFFGIPLLDKCTSETKYHNEEDIENIDDETPPRGVPSRYW